MYSKLLHLTCARSGCPRAQFGLTHSCVNNVQRASSQEVAGKRQVCTFMMHLCFSVIYYQYFLQCKVGRYLLLLTKELLFHFIPHGIISNTTSSVPRVAFQLCTQTSVWLGTQLKCHYFWDISSIYTRMLLQILGGLSLKSVKDGHHSIHRQSLIILWSTDAQIESYIFLFHKTSEKNRTWLDQIVRREY